MSTRAKGRLLKLVLLGLAGGVLLVSCQAGLKGAGEGPVQSAAYLWQAAVGQFRLMRDARPVGQVLADPTTPPEVRRKLALAEQVRQFALTELGLPDHGAYTKYTDLRRPYVVWNVFSAPELSTRLRTKCYPVTGCVSYQGFFSEAAAGQEADRRRQAGEDVLMGGITAYSTLGYLPDPLLSSMFQNSEAWLVRTVIHELSHPALYVAGDTAFNESFATAIENEGMRRWLAGHAPPELAARLAQQDAAERERNGQWQALLLEARQELDRLYAQAMPDSEKRQHKAAILDDLQARATALRREWFGPQASPAARQNNASLGAVAAYADLVPEFEQLLARVNGDIPAFIVEAKKCAAQPKERRAACLRDE